MSEEREPQAPFFSEDDRRRIFEAAVRLQIASIPNGWRGGKPKLDPYAAVSIARQTLLEVRLQA